MEYTERHPWSHGGKLEYFQRTVERAAACRAVHLSLASHSLRAVLALANKLLSAVPSWQDQLASNMSNDESIQQSLLLVRPKVSPE